MRRDTEVAGEKINALAIKSELFLAVDTAIVWQVAVADEGEIFEFALISHTPLSNFEMHSKAPQPNFRHRQKLAKADGASG